jgi:ribosomal protein L37AE/L43A
MKCGELTNPDAKHNVLHKDPLAATCYENGNLEYWYCDVCGQAWLDEAGKLNTNLMSVVLPMAHAPATHVEAKAATCTETGNIEYWLCEVCGQAWLDEACTRNTNVLAVVLPTIDHNFIEGKCECGAEDPNYVPPVVNDYLINFSTWPEFVKETYADGDIVKHNDIFTFIMGKNSRVDVSEKTWDDFQGTLRFSLGGKTNEGVPTKNAIQITVDGAYTLKIW